MTQNSSLWEITLWKKIVWTSLYSLGLNLFVSGLILLLFSSFFNPTVECDVLPSIDHGSLNCTNSFQFRSVCQYNCALGYNISGGNQLLSCKKDGLWSGIIPMCQPGNVRQAIKSVMSLKITMKILYNAENRETIKIMGVIPTCQPRNTLQGSKSVMSVKITLKS